MFCFYFIHISVFYGISNNVFHSKRAKMPDWLSPIHLQNNGSFIKETNFQTTQNSQKIHRHVCIPTQTCLIFIFIKTCLY